MTEDIDKYARDCHQLISVEKGVPVQCQSTVELLCSRVVQLLDRVASLESSQSVTLRDPRCGGHVVQRNPSIRVPEGGEG